MASPTPFQINIPQSSLDDLKERLQRTRLPDQIPGAGWDMGTEPGYLQVILLYKHCCIGSAVQALLQHSLQHHRVYNMTGVTGACIG